jgi:hypothetical protein
VIAGANRPTRGCATRERWNSVGHGVIVTAMAKHRELASVVYAGTLGHTSASKIWRTVVFAGAMLAAPIGCGGGHKKPETVQPQPVEKQADPDQAAKDAAAKDAADKAAADKAAADQQAMKDEADKKAADEAAAKEAADKQAAEEQAAADAAKKKPRPRTGSKNRPTGRGFILS